MMCLYLIVTAVWSLTYLEKLGNNDRVVATLCSDDIVLYSVCSANTHINC